MSENIQNSPKQMTSPHPSGNSKLHTLLTLHFLVFQNPPPPLAPPKKIPSMGGNIGIFWICAVKISLKGLRHGILSYFYHQQNYL